MPALLEPGALAGLAGPWALANARVWDGRGAIHAAVSFGADGLVQTCGSADGVLARLPPGAEVVDARGAFVCPGFVDAHVHVRAAASARLAVDVSAAHDPAGLLESVRGARLDGGGFATFVGLQAERIPHRRQLDLVTGPARVRIRDRRGHGWLLNSAGLEALGVDADGTRDVTPDGVLVERGSDLTPTGFVTDHVGWIGIRLGRLSDPAALAYAVAGWSRELARSGVVAFCDATATNLGPQLDALIEWRRSGALRQECTALASPDLSARQAPVWGVKFADAHDPRLPAALRGATTVAVHCVDPTELGAVLDAARAVRREAALRLEHASFVPPDWVAEVRRTGATVVTQPAFVEAYGDRYLDDPALEPHDWLYRLASWSEAGVPLAFGSDAPFGPTDPLGALDAAAARRTSAGRLLGAAEALGGEQALRAATVTAAECSGLAHLGYGRLMPGGTAAAVVLSEDPRRGPAQVVDVVIEGAVVD